jgi:plastocyanin
MIKFWQNIAVVIGGILLVVSFVFVGNLIAQQKPTVAIREFQFQPSQIDVKAGTAVTWVNEDDAAHTITSGTPEKPDGRFDSRLQGKGSTFSFTFAEPGTYSYFCSRHRSMQGQIRVM